MLKEYFIKNGIISDGLYVCLVDPIQVDRTEFSPAFGYNAEENYLFWFLQTSSEETTAKLIIKIDQIDGTYSYMVDVQAIFRQVMMGEFSAPLLNNLSRLPYTYSSLDLANFNTSMAELACSLVKAIVPTADLFFLVNNMQLTSANFGFN